MSPSGLDWEFARAEDGGFELWSPDTGGAILGHGPTQIAALSNAVENLSSLRDELAEIVEEAKLKAAQRVIRSGVDVPYSLPCVASAIDSLEAAQGNAPTQEIRDLLINAKQLCHTAGSLLLAKKNEGATDGQGEQGA